MGSAGPGLRVAAAVALGLTAVWAGAPAHAMNYGPGAPATWVFTDLATPSQTQLDPPGDTPLGSFVVDGVKHTRRAYFTYDLTGFRGQVLHRATLSASETSVTDCGTAGPIEVWRTGPIGQGTSWARPPAELELAGHVEYGKGGLCPGAYLGVDVLSQVDAAIARGDKAISFEARIAAGAEARALAGRMMQPFRLTIWGNHAPTVSRLGLRGPERGCGTPQERPVAGGRTTLALHVGDADRQQPRSVQFAIWPVDRPGERKQIRGGYGSDPTAVADLSGYPDGTVLAWAGLARDADDASPWSPPCFLTVDNTPPRTPPAVGTTDCTGTFVLGAGGDPDTVAFDWSAPGRRGEATGRQARLSLGAGAHEIKVGAVDAAGNRGQPVAYSCTPPAGDAPDVSIPALVAGEAGTITLTSHSTGVIAYEYDFGDGRRRVDAGPGGTAQLPWTPGRSGAYTLTVSSVTDSGALSGSREQSFDVIDPRPSLRSASDKVIISSDLPDGADYRYSVDGAPERSVRFAREVTVPVVPTHAGSTVVDARVRRADGSFTPAGRLTLHVSSGPLIKPVESLGVPAVAGRIGAVTLTPGQRPGVVGYRYTFDRDAGEQTVAAKPDGTATVAFTPGRPGWRVLTAVSVAADGTVSDSRDYPIVVADPAVQVTASWPASGEALGLDVPGTFGFLGDLTGETTDYLWHVDDGPVRTMPRDADEAITSVAYTPGHTGPSTLAVQRRFRDGSLSPVTEYHFDVGTLPRVVADPGRGTPGRPSVVTFAGGMPDVVSFDYQIVGDSDGAVDNAGTVLADDDGAAQVTFVPPSADNYRVIVTGHAADGAATGTATLMFPAYL
jgi:hypothetical protein